MVQKADSKKTAVLKEKSLSFGELISMGPMQIIFLVFVISTICAIVPWVYYSYLSIEEIKAASPDGYEFPSFWDFRMTGVSALVFACT